VTSPRPERRPIPGYDERYAVEADGTVWSCAVRGQRGRSGRWRRLAVNKGSVSIIDAGGQSRNAPLHTLVALAWPADGEGEPGEEWRTIPGCAGHQASDRGRIRSLRSGRPQVIVDKFQHFRRYAQVHRVAPDGAERRTCEPVADLVLSAFGVAGYGRAVYLDGDPTNCALSNLRWTVELEGPVAPAPAGLDIAALADLLAERVPRIVLNVTRAAPAADLADALRSLRGLQQRIEDFAACVSDHARIPTAQEVADAVDERTRAALEVVQSALPTAQALAELRGEVAALKDLARDDAPAKAAMPLDIDALAAAVAKRVKVLAAAAAPAEPEGKRRGSGSRRLREQSHAEVIVETAVGALGAHVVAELLGVGKGTVRSWAAGDTAPSDDYRLRLEWLYLHARRSALGWGDEDMEAFEALVRGERRAHLEVAAWGER